MTRDDKDNDISHQTYTLNTLLDLTLLLCIKNGNVFASRVHVPKGHFLFFILMLSFPVSLLAPSREVVIIPHYSS